MEGATWLHTASFPLLNLRDISSPRVEMPKGGFFDRWLRTHGDCRFFFGFSFLSLYFFLFIAVSRSRIYMRVIVSVPIFDSAFSKCFLFRNAADTQSEQTKRRCTERSTDSCCFELFLLRTGTNHLSTTVHARILGEGWFFGTVWGGRAEWNDGKSLFQQIFVSAVTKTHGEMFFFLELKWIPLAK